MVLASSLIALDILRKILRKIEKPKIFRKETVLLRILGGKKVVFSCFGIEIFGRMKKKV